MIKKVEQYGIFELSVSTDDSESVKGCFTNGIEKKTVNAVYDGKHKALIRFMPHTTGRWKYEITGSEHSVNGMFDCVNNTHGNHGTVKTTGFHFMCSDGMRFIPFGTTCYAWVHQSDELVAETLESLKNSPFNKVRMCVFPKSMAYNNNDPQYFPFHKNQDGSWNVKHPNKQFWRRFEKAVCALRDCGIEADVILFHPYDRWGFSTLSREDSLEYIKYCVRRLSAYSNVWWSLANEYELLLGKSHDDWQAFGSAVKENDIYGHLISIHNFCNPYPRSEWMTHCSVQTANTSLAQILRYKYKLPVINDECGYEGNLEFRWGNLSGFEFINRMWTCIVSGGYCSHGETFYNDDEIIWWAKGGKLVGKAISRIKFLKELLQSLPIMDPLIPFGSFENMDVEGQGTEFMQAMKDLTKEQRDLTTLDMLPMIIGNNSCRLYYYGRGCPCRADVSILPDGDCKIEIIDVWEMTRTTFDKCATADCTVKLPSKEGIAILITLNNKKS